MKLHPGENNDVVAIYIDGVDVGQRFTSWENYSRAVGASPPEINSLMFRANEPGFTEQNGGYLFFGESETDGNGSGPPGPDVGIDKTASARAVSPGGLVSYTITAHNHGNASARNLLACDRIPRHETFVRANRRLLHVGSRRCLTINRLAPGQSAGFVLTARVSRNAPAGRIDNTTDEENAEDVTPPPLPPVPDVPGKVVRPTPKPEGGASVNVVRPAAPSFTG